MKNKEVFISSSEEETAKFAYKLTRNAKPGTLYTLFGDLGAGKSVFSRGFIRSFGVTGAIPSPTFTIVQDYNINASDSLNGIETIYHMDLYRIQDSNAAYIFGIDDYLDEPSAINLIEWPERIEEILPAYNVVRIDIKHIDEEHREIIVTSD